MRDKERERGRDTGRGRSRLHAGSPMWGLDPGSPGLRPGPKARAEPLRHPGIPPLEDFKQESNIMWFRPQKGQSNW